MSLFVVAVDVVSGVIVVAVNTCRTSEKVALVKYKLFLPLNFTIM